MRARGPKPISLGRHRRCCTICHHEQRREIERAFISWESPTAIAKEYGMDRGAIYRHATAYRLFQRRRENVRAALEKIIEHASEVEDISASAIVSAVVALGKISAAGKFVEPQDRVTMHELFTRLSRAELEVYCETGCLPSWFQELVESEGHVHSRIVEHTDE